MIVPGGRALGVGMREGLMTVYDSSFGAFT